VPQDGGWLVGDRLSIADISVASVFVNMMHAGAAPDPQLYPKLTAYVQRWFERPSLKPIIAREKAFLSRA
jgi:glutathione S-transferase